MVGRLSLRPCRGASLVRWQLRNWNIDFSIYFVGECRAQCITVKKWHFIIYFTKLRFGGSFCIQLGG